MVTIREFPTYYLSFTKFKLAMLAIFFLVSFNAFAAKINVEVDRNPVEADESFTITFTANEAVDGQPDFRPLEKFFKIMSRNQSSNIQIINGRMSRQTQWILYAMPKRSGDLWIPSVAFGDDRSPRLQIRVNAAKQQSGNKTSGVLFLEDEVDNKSVYVQSQILYTIRIYQAVNLLNASLSDLSLSDTDAIVEKVGEDKSFEKLINGRRFKVFEKHYVIFPQKSGTLTINPEELEAQYVDSRRALRTKVLRSEAINIEVKPKPLVQTVQNNMWLPAAQMQIKEEWPQDPPKFKVGEPVTRTITIVASGLSSSQLPEIKTAEITNMKQYLDQPTLKDKKSVNGVIGMRQEKIALIPTKTGQFVIPEIQIPWWNTGKDRLEYLRLPKRQITVEPGAQGSQQQPANLTRDTQPLESSTAAGDVPSNSTPETQGDSGITPPGQPASGFWMWVSFIAIVGWLITAVAWWRRGMSSTGRTDFHKQIKLLSVSRPDTKQYEKSLKNACSQHNAQGAKDTLLQWGKKVWPQASPGNLNELSRLCGTDLGEQLLLLNKHLYSNNNANWDSEKLWQSFIRFNVKPDGNQPNLDGAVLPLFRTTV